MNEIPFKRGFFASAVMRPTSGRWLIVCAALLCTADRAAAQLGGVSLSGSQIDRKIFPGTKDQLIFTLTISSSLLLSETLNGIVFTNTTNGPGTEEQLDAQLGELSLYRDTLGNSFDPSTDVLIGEAKASGGVVRFSGLNVIVAPLVPVTLHVALAVPAQVHDTDKLDLEISNAAAVVFGRPVGFNTPFPVNPGGDLEIDGMVAAQVQVQSLPNATVLPGSSGNLAYDLRVFGNGYLSDQLRDLRVRNAGNAVQPSDISALEVWIDGGNETFDAGGGDDASIGVMQIEGVNWKLTGIDRLVPVSGIRLFITAKIASFPVSGRTIALRVLGPDDKGVVMASNNDGLLDAPAPNSNILTITVPPSVIHASAAPQTWQLAHPGGPSFSIYSLQLVNVSAQAETLSTIKLTNTTAGPGNQDQLDSNWMPVTMSATRSSSGNINLSGIIPAGGVAFVNGQATFSGLSLRMAPGDSTTLNFQSSASIMARDPDLLDVALADSLHLTFTRPVRYSGTFPVAPGGSFPVDGMVAGQITFENPGPPSFLTGSLRNVAVSAVIPSNGYEADLLQRIDVRNDGVAVPGTDITRVELWADNGSGAFELGADDLLGQLLFTGDRWEITGLSHPIPAGGGRIFVTCDIAASASDGASIQFVLAALPDVSIGMASSNDGPIDTEAPNPWTQTISSVDRIVLSGESLPAGTVAPGEQNVPILYITLSNTYSVAKTLAELAVTNSTSGIGTPAELDSEVELLTLHVDDGDSRLEGSLEDPVLGSAFFTANRAVFSNLDLKLDPGEAIGLFVGADVSLLSAADGDILRAQVQQAGDLVFTDATATAASWPLQSGFGKTIDGMMAVQLDNRGAPARTIGPSEGPALAFDVVIPSNGYAPDILRGVTFENAGTAGPPDIDSMVLWRDGGNGAFDAGATDDAFVASLNFLGGNWRTPVLSFPIPSGGVHFYASIVSSSTPTDSATVVLQIPVNGLVVESRNDGPRDAAVTNPEAQLLSTAALLANLEMGTAVSTIGQLVFVSLHVRNAGLATVDSIAPSALLAEGSGAFSQESGPVPGMLSLSPGEESTFAWTFRSTGAGEVRLQGAVSGVEEGTGALRQSLTATSNPHNVFIEAQTVNLFPVTSMPYSVNRGQTDVVPLTLTFAHPGDPLVSPIRLHNLQVSLENDIGEGVVPADLLSRVVVNEGATQYLVKTALETSGSTIDLPLTTPVVIPPAGQATLNLRLDILDSTLVPTFRVAIADSSWFAAEDAINSAAVDVSLQEGAYPIQSGLARVVADAAQLEVSAAADSSQSISQGQDDVTLLLLDLLNPDPGGLASDIRLGTFDVQLTDSAGAVLLDPGALMTRIRVRTSFQTLLDRSFNAADDSTMTLVLQPILSIPVNTPVQLRISADIADAAAIGKYHLKAGASSSFDARDANTGDPLPVFYPSGEPIGPEITVEAQAKLVLVGGAARFPPSTPVGTADLEAFTVELTHPGATGTARIRCDSLTVELHDDRGDPLSAATFLDRVRVERDGVEVGDIAAFPEGDEFSIPLTGVSLGPGETASLSVRVDLEATAPASFLEMTVDESAVHAVDSNLDTPVAIANAPGTEMPIRSGLLRIEAPARLLIAGFTSDMPAVLVAGGHSVHVARLTLRNPAPLASSTIHVERLTLSASDGAGGAIAMQSAARTVSILRDGVVWAEASTDSMATLEGAQPLLVAPGETVSLDIVIETADQPATPSVRVGVFSSGIGVVQPSSTLLEIQLQPEDQQSFPFWSQAGNFSFADLHASYSNFPNPFAAGRQETTFAFYLRESARVKLRILTIRGEEVMTLLHDETLDTGLHQSQTWNGQNERGETVVNGVYVADLEVRYADGSNARELRKVAVVR